ncbi:MAG: hypothetical protein ACRD20_18205 [Terriglobales bacterium]
MATSAAGISVGDAVLTFLANTTDVDQALARLGTEVPAKLKPSGDAVQALGKGFTDVGASADKAAKSAAPVGDEFKKAGEKAEFSMAKAKGEVGLLGEATGVVLPRHVRAFLAELPGVGAALNAAFAATAVLFIIDAIIKAGEKIEEFREKPRKVAESLRDLDDAAILADRSLTQAFNASKAEQIGATQGAVAKLDFELQHMASSAEIVAGKIAGIGATLQKSLELQQTSKLDLLSFFLPNSRDVTKEAQIFVSQLQSTLLELGNQAGLKLLEQELQNVGAEMKTTADRFNADAGKIGGALDDIDHGSRDAAEVDRQRLLSLGLLTEGLEKYQKTILDGIRLDEQAKKAKAQQEISAQAQQLAEEAKRDLDADIANIQARQAAEHIAFVSGEIDAASWAVAQKNAVDAATAVHERYLARLVDIYKQSGDAVKSQSAAQDLATAQVLDGAQKTEALAAATEKYHQATLKIVKDWSDLQNQAVAKNFEAAQQAAENLTRTELRLADAQEKLALAKISQDFGPQETAIQNLANFGIITEQQKAQRLRVLYEQEERDALAALRKLQVAEQNAIQAAQAKLEEKKASPFASQADIDQAQKYLDEVQRLYAQTQGEILNTTASYEAKRISVERGAVAQAIALAQSEGRQKLAAELLFKQAQLDEINNEIRLAKAHDLNTAALQRERKEIEQQVKELVQETRSVGDTSRALVLMQKLGSEALQGLGSAIESSFAAAISNQESFGAAMEAGTLRVISQMAQHWADYFLAKAIPDLFFDPPLGAAELAGGLALEVVAGVTSGLASNIDSKAQASASGSSSGSSASGAAGPGQQSPTQTAPQPVQVVNAQRFAKGALINKAMPAWVGDSESGGDATEAIIPLDDDRATTRIAAAIAKPLQYQGGLLSRGTVSAIGPMVIGGTTSQQEPAISAAHEQRFDAVDQAIENLLRQRGDIHITIEPGMNMNKVVRTISQHVKKGRVRLDSSNSARVTKRG